MIVLLKEKENLIVYFNSCYVSISLSLSQLNVSFHFHVQFEFYEFILPMNGK